MTMDLKKELQAVNKEIKALTKKVEKLITDAGRFENPKTKSHRVKSVKMSADKPPAVQKPAGLSAADMVFRVISRSPKGVDTATLMKKTGFNEKKIHNNVYKLKKQGRIRSDAKGIYLTA